MRQLSLLHTVVSAFIPVPRFFCYCHIPSWNVWNQVLTLLRKIFRQKEIRAERILTSIPHYSPIRRAIKTASTWMTWSHPTCIQFASPRFSRGVLCPRRTEDKRFPESFSFLWHCILLLNMESREKTRNRHKKMVWMVRNFILRIQPELFRHERSKIPAQEKAAKDVLPCPAVILCLSRHLTRKLLCQRHILKSMHNTSGFWFYVVRL